MRFAVMGTGGAGGYFGALLARAGHDVAFVARGEHLRAIRARGLSIQSPHGDFAIAPARATDDPAEIGVVDAVIFAVKTYDTQRAAELVRPCIGARTLVVPLQNGVETPSQLASVLGAAAVIGGAAWIVSFVTEPGAIRHDSTFRRIVLGELDGRVTERVQSLQRALAESGATAETSADITAVLWTKLLFFASFAGIATLSRSPAEGVLGCSESRALLERAMREVECVARAHGIRLAPDAVDAAMTFAKNLAPQATSSLQRDVIAGRRSEFDALSGAVVRAGRAAGVATPIHECIWASLSVVERRASIGVQERRRDAARP